MFELALSACSQSELYGNAYLLDSDGFENFRQKFWNDTLQFFELQDNDKNWGILIENGRVDWCPAYIWEP
jgi:hypothetical protein